METHHPRFMHWVRTTMMLYTGLLKGKRFPLILVAFSLLTCFAFIIPPSSTRLIENNRTIPAAEDERVSFDIHRGPKVMMTDDLPDGDEAFELGIAHGLGQLQIEQEVNQHNWTMPDKPSNKVKRIMIVTTWRSGSSFLGELISSAPGVFYSYEPLHFIEYHKPKPNVTEMELLRSIFDCRFSADYLLHFNKRSEGGQRYLQRNARVWEACQIDSESLCVRPDFIGRLCAYFPVQLVKEVRLTLKKFVDNKIMDKLMGDWKVIYLVRDPRAVMASRSNFTWCQKDPSCGNVKQLCRDQQSDFALLKKLKARRPDRFYLIRYEDLMGNVASETKKLFNFLGMTVTPSVRVFIDTHTRRPMSDDQSENPHSTYRLSNETVFAWRRKLKAKEISKYSRTCHTLLKALKYS